MLGQSTFSPRHSADQSHYMFGSKNNDTNTSTISDLRQDLDSARRLPNNSEKKDRLLSDVQIKLAELLE